MLIVSGLTRSEIERVTRALCRFEDSAAVPEDLRDGAAAAVCRWLPGQGVHQVGFVEVARYAAWGFASTELRAVVGELAPRSVARQVALPFVPPRERCPAPTSRPAVRVESTDERGVLVVVSNTVDADRHQAPSCTVANRSARRRRLRSAERGSPHAADR